MRRLPTGKYAGKPEATWITILAAAKRIPRLRKLAENYEATGHPACLNAIMDNATAPSDGALWLIFLRAAG